MLGEYYQTSHRGCIERISSEVQFGKTRIGFKVIRINVEPLFVFQKLYVFFYKYNTIGYVVLFKLLLQITERIRKCQKSSTLVKYNNELNIPSGYHKLQLCLFQVTFKSYSVSCGDIQQNYRVSEPGGVGEVSLDSQVQKGNRISALEYAVGSEPWPGAQVHLPVVNQSSLPRSPKMWFS